MLRRLGRRATVSVSPLVKQAWSSSPGRSGVAALVVIAGAGGGVAAMVLTGRLLEAATVRDSTAVLRLLTLSLILAVSLAVLRLIGELILQRLADDVEVRLRRRVLVREVLPVGISHLEREDNLNRVSVESGLGAAAQYPPSKAITGLSALGSRWAITLAGAVLVTYYWWWAGIVVLASWIYLSETVRQLRLAVLNVWTGHATELRRAEYLRELASSQASALELRVFGFGTWLIDQFVQSWYVPMRIVWAARHRSAFNVWPPLVVLFVVHGAVFAALAWDTVAGARSIADVVIVVSAIASMSAIANWTDDDTNVQYGAQAVAAADRDGLVVPSHRQTPAAIPRVPSSLEFRDVTFTYPGSVRPVLSLFSAKFDAGSSSAIVGLNGAGTSTFVKLALGMYVPDEGEVLVNGVRLTEDNCVEWRKRVAAVFQDFLRLELDLRDNVAYNWPLSPETEEGVHAALESAHFNVENLPYGLDTIMSSAYSGGTQLSGGQWQRVALARAAFAISRGADFVILDEPTSSLDARVEEEVFEHYRGLMSDITSIIISHRLSAVRYAGKIVVLDGGHKVEEGTHASLIASGGLYGDLYRAQSDRFSDGVEVEA